MNRIPGSACAWSISAAARTFQSAHARGYGSGKAMKRTLPASNQYQSSPQQLTAGAPGEAWGFGRSNRPV